MKTSIDELNELSSKTDIIFLQECWLLEEDLTLLNEIGKDHYAAGISSMDSKNKIIAGRLFCGFAILWHKAIGQICNVIQFDDERKLMRIEITGIGRKVLLINVYIPKCCEENLPDFHYYTAKLHEIIEADDTPFVFATGDFNADTQSHHKFGCRVNRMLQR